MHFESQFSGFSLHGDKKLVLVSLGIRSFGPRLPKSDSHRDLLGMINFALPKVLAKGSASNPPPRTVLSSNRLMTEGCIAGAVRDNGKSAAAARKGRMMWGWREGLFDGKLLKKEPRLRIDGVGCYCKKN